MSDVSCSVCGTVLGWKYVEAQEESQRYKVGKFILETKKIRGSVHWENGAGDCHDGSYGGVEGMPPVELGPAKDEAVEFDSQDEDECEDLFAGVWSPELALKRRRGRRFGRGGNGNGGAGGSGSGGSRARSEDVR